MHPITLAVHRKTTPY